jgi:hypothetical protein
MAITFRLKALNAPPGQQCLTTLQDTLNKTAQFMQVIGPDSATFLVMSNAEPSADLRDQAWLKLEANGKPEGFYKFQTGEWWRVPGLHVGAIIGYSGSLSNIPDGWTLADGTNGTPDLTDNTAFASWWEPNYSAPTTSYTLCPIYHVGLSA